MKKEEENLISGDVPLPREDHHRRVFYAEEDGLSVAQARLGYIVVIEIWQPIRRFLQLVNAEDVRIRVKRRRNVCNDERDIYLGRALQSEDVVGKKP